MQKWPSYSEKAARLGINVNIVYQNTAVHGSSFSISSENPYKNEMTLWHVKEQIIKQDNTHHEPEGLHLSNRGWHTHGFRHPKEASPEVVILLINNDCQCKGRYFSSYSIPIEFKKLIYSSLSDTFL